MKSPFKTFTPVCGALAVFFGSTLVGTAAAVSTDPVGYVTVTLPAGASLLTAPLAKEVQFAGVAGVVSGNSVSISGLPALATPSFLQVTGETGGLATILSSDGSSVTLEEAIVGLTEGDTVRIIQHFTLGDLTEASSSSVPDNSIVTVYSSDGSINSYSSIDDKWYASGSFVANDDVIIFPGEGFAFNLQSQVEFTFTGSVNTEPFQILLTNGVVNIIGTLNPTTGTGVDSIGALLRELGNNSSITVYSSDGGLQVLNTYGLIDNQWYESGSFSPTEVTVAAPATIVVNPQVTSTVTVPEAY